MKRAFLFPGQGTQIVGMGKDIYEKYDEAKKIYDNASEISGMDIKQICFKGPEEILNKTKNTQICILTCSLAILEILKIRGIKANITAGLSLGEYVALIYSGVLKFEDGINLIKKRGYYMQNMLPNGNYSMSAVIGLDREKIEQICSKINANGSFVVPVNYNCATQTTISGDSEALEKAVEMLKLAGAKRVIELNTSGPFHTCKLEKAKEMYEKDLQKVNFGHLKNIKVIKNLDGTYYNSEDNIKDILAKHIVSAVRFDKCIELMKKEKVEEYVEIGPGKTLTGFIKKEIKDANVVNINNVESLEKFLDKENN